MKKSLLLCLAAAASLCASATITYDGMQFEINDEVAKTATLTVGKSSPSNVFVPETVTANGITYTVNTIGENAFYQCEMLGVLSLPTTVVNLEFCAFQKLTASSVRITGDLQSMAYGAFFGNNLQAIICYSTTYFTHDMGVLTNKEKNIILAFPGRPTNEKWGTANLTIPEGYEYIAPYAFSQNPNLTGITIPASVKEIGVGAFYEIPKLRTITIQGGNTIVGDRAFMGCEQVTSVNLPVGLKTVGHSAFFDLVALKTLTLPEGMEHTGVNSFANCGLTTLNLPSTLRVIGDRSFMNNSDLQSVTLPESADTIEYSAFSGCDLRSIDFNHVRYVGELSFTNNTNLATFSGNYIEQIDNAAFYGCTSLNGFTLPNSLRELTQTTFYLCSGITSLTIPAGVETIGDCITVGTTSLNAIDIDPANTHFDVSEGWLYSADFKRLVAIPGAVTGVLTIPDGVEAIGGQVGRRLAISEVVVPNSVKSIENAAFMQCGQLTKVTLGAKVATMAGNTFNNCSAITEVTCLNRVPPTNGIFVDAVYAAATLYVPRGSKEAYQADENWSKFATIEEIDVEEPAGVPGDLNDDGKVDVSDVNIAINIILGQDTEEAVKALADLNGDNKVDVSDVNALINIILKN